MRFRLSVEYLLITSPRPAQFRFRRSDSANMESADEESPATPAAKRNRNAPKQERRSQGSVLLYRIQPLRACTPERETSICVSAPRVHRTVRQRFCSAVLRGGKRRQTFVPI